MHLNPRLGRALLGAPLLLVLACSAPAQSDPCTVADNGDGSYTISCPDGTSATLHDGAQGVAGADGSSCTVDPNGDGTKTISCDDGTSVTISDGSDAAAILARTDTVAPGDDCAEGGSSVSFGHDADGDGALSDTEIESTTFVCNGPQGDTGEAGLQALVRIEPEAAGDICADGGLAVMAGLDANDDGYLSTSEVDHTRYVCNGAAGQDGSSCSVTDNADGTKTISCDDGTEVTLSDGADGTSCSVQTGTDGTRTITCDDGTSAVINDGAAGYDSLVRQDTLDVGSTECPTGGVAVKTGLDADRSGTLEDGEVSQTTYVCNGPAGQAGEAALVRLVPELPGVHCTAGGTAVQTGTDTDGNGTLEDAEVLETAYVCNGVSTTARVEMTFRGFDAVAPGELSPVSIDAKLLQDPGVPVLWRLTLTDDAGQPVAGARAYYFSGQQGEDPADPSTWVDSIVTSATGEAFFGPPGGFSASELFAGVTTDFGLVIANEGTYHLAVDLLDATAGDVIDGSRVDFTLVAPMLVQSYTGFDALVAYARGPVSVSSTLRQDPGVPVRWRFTLTDDQGAPVEGAEVFYFSGAAGETAGDSSTFVSSVVTGADGVAFFGPAAGFDAAGLLGGITTLFDAKVPVAGTFDVLFELIDPATGEVFASDATTATVAQNLAITFNGFDAIEAGTRSAISVTSTLTADPGVPVRWRMTLTDATGHPVPGAVAYYPTGAATETPDDPSTFTASVTTDVDGIAWFGPASGFDATDAGLLTGITTWFGVEIADAGDYTLALDLVDMDSGAALDGSTVDFTAAFVFSGFNGDFEVWTPDGLPANWAGNNGVAVEHETTVVHGGTSSVKLTRTLDNNGATEFSSGLAPILAGAGVTIGAWYLDDTVDARGRLVYQFYAADGTALANASYGDYTVDGADWQQLTATVTAPADAAFVRVATRIYKDAGAATGGFVYLDDVTVDQS